MSAMPPVPGLPVARFPRAKWDLVVDGGGDVYRVFWRDVNVHVE